MAYHVGQSYPPLIVDTELDISSGTSFAILYKKPSGEKGRWTGTLSGTTEIQYTLSAGDLDEGGKWQVQAYAIVGGKAAYGEKATLVVDDPVQVQPDC